MATWPATLPNPTTNGYQVAPAKQAMRTEMEAGAARTRRTSKAKNDKVTLTWQFTDAQMAIFRTWFESDTEAAGGSAWFSISLPIGNTGLTAEEARFVGEYKMDALEGLNWRVSAQVEVR
jgi:DNA segregation ATPase FtsK/SpoIIIE-like protein